MAEAIERTQGGAGGATATSTGVLRPTRPHDSMSFEELAGAYNFERTSMHRTMFARLVVRECQRRGGPGGAAGAGPVRVLDVGCGRGIGREVALHHAIRPHVGDYWGIEPDEEVSPEAGLFDHFQHALMETAKLPEGVFDLVYAYMVMEHVADPDGFMRAVSRCLKPGGSFLFATPNGRHYFTMTANTLHRLRLDEAVLRLVRGATKDEYHYPVQYLFNTERAVNECARRTGFGPPEYAYIEFQGPGGYMRGPLKPLYHALRMKRRMIRKPGSLLCMIGRITKPA